MAPRFPIDEAPGGGQQRKEFTGNSLKAIHPGASLPWIEEDGSSLLGFYAAMSYSPDKIVEPLFDIAKNLYSTDDLKPRVREITTLGLVSIIDVPFIRKNHRNIAGKLGITSEQYDQGLAGQTPEGLSKEENLAYRLARKLTVLDRPLDEATWQEATTAFTKPEFVAIVHNVASHRWMALLDMVNADPGWYGEQASNPAES